MFPLRMNLPTVTSPRTKDPEPGYGMSWLRIVNDMAGALARMPRWISLPHEANAVSHIGDDFLGINRLDGSYPPMTTTCPRCEKSLKKPIEIERFCPDCEKKEASCA